MELEIFREKLNQCLNVLDFVTKKTSNLPILNNVFLEAEKNFLKLSATNLEVSIMWWILSKIKTEGKVVVPSSFLKPLIGFTSEEVFKLKTENNNLILETENQTTQIQGVNPDDFPIIPKIVKDEYLEIDGGKLEQGLGQVINIPALSQIRPEIAGIYFSFKKDELKIVATDSFRLAEKNIKLPQKNKKDFSFILPQFAARSLMNILGLKQGALKIYPEANQVLFEWLGEETNYIQIHFSSRLIEGNYPDYQEIIPKKYTSQIIVKKEQFQNQIKKAGLFSGRMSEVKITLFPQENKIKLFSESVNIGRNEAVMPVKMERKTNESLESSFNYKFLLDGLVNIKSSEILFGFGEQEGPAVIKGVGDESFVYILMPIKNV